MGLTSGGAIVVSQYFGFKDYAKMHQAVSSMISFTADMIELESRILWAYLLEPHLGIKGIWIAPPLAWETACLLIVIRYYSGK